MENKTSGAQSRFEAVAIPVPEPDPKSMFGVDKNINMTTIDNWLGRGDVLYRDVRMLFDPADYAAIGGNPDLSETITGFKIIPYPYLATLPKLPVKNAYTGDVLFTLTWDKKGTITSATANYKQSLTILEELFPKNKKIFIMCGGGGYASMTRALLIHLGWNANDLYNIGGNWAYKGDNSLKLIEYPEETGGDTLYALWRADYALIDFTRLNKVE